MHLQRPYFNEIQILRTQDMPLSLSIVDIRKPWE